MSICSNDNYIGTYLRCYKCGKPCSPAEPKTRTCPQCKNDLDVSAYGRYLSVTKEAIEELKSFIRAELQKQKEEFLKGERCLRCGKYKMTKRPDLTDFCYKCYEEE